MTFDEFVQAQGGATEVARKTSGAVSRAHVANIAAGRKRLTPDVAAALEEAFPEVAAEVWYGWTKAALRERAAEPAHTPAQEA